MTFKLLKISLSAVFWVFPQRAGLFVISFFPVNRSKKRMLLQSLVETVPVKTGCLFLMVSTVIWSQQTKLTGIVSVHNSKYETGATQYVKDAYVTAPFTKSANTDESGTFALAFVGIEGGTSIKLQVEKQGLEIVNLRDLEDVVIGRTSPVRIFLTEKGKLAQVQTELYNISKKALFAKKDTLITKLHADIKESNTAIAELEKQFHKKLANRFEAENLLNEKIEAMQKRLPEFAQELAERNLDFASDLYIKAYELFKKGNIEQAIKTLDNETLKESYTKAVKTLAKGKQLVSFTGPCVDPRLETLDIENGYNSVITMARPIVDNGQANISIASRQALDDTVEFGVVSVPYENRNNLRSGGRYHRIRVEPVGDGWTTAVATDLTITPSGQR